MIIQTPVAYQLSDYLNTCHVPVKWLSKRLSYIPVNWLSKHLSQISQAFTEVISPTVYYPDVCQKSTGNKLDSHQIIWPQTSQFITNKPVPNQSIYDSHTLQTSKSIVHTCQKPSITIHIHITNQSIYHSHTCHKSVNLSSTHHKPVNLSSTHITNQSVYHSYT